MDEQTWCANVKVEESSTESKTGNQNKSCKERDGRVGEQMTSLELANQKRVPGLL